MMGRLATRLVRPIAECGAGSEGEVETDSTNVLAFTFALSAIFVARPGVGADAESAHAVHLFPSASDVHGRQGFARVVNHSVTAGEVTIRAFDDAGVAYGPVTLAIGANRTLHFNSADLEDGNAAKGLSGGVGAGAGDWRLALASALDIEVLSYVRAADGFLTAMHDAAPVGSDRRLGVAMFNPGSNADQESLLRLVNPGDGEATVMIAGIDDAGAAPGPGATATVPARGGLTYSSAELESGGAAGLAGAIGNGTGKWRLTVDSAQEVVAMSLLASPTGHLTNLSSAPAGYADGSWRVPLFPSASGERQGFVRVVNRSSSAGEVSIEAFDDTDRDYEPLTLTIEAGAAAHFNSDDLELGNAAKGLVGSTGPGEGDWRLDLASALDIEVLAYVRTTDGFLTAMHDTVPRLARRHRVVVFNPGSNVEQESLLRLVNPGETAVEATIRGVDDAGASAAAAVRIAVPAGRSRTLSARQLEAGGEGFEGALGDGAGKWRLVIDADRPVLAMSLLSSPTGHLTNLSTAPGRGAGSPESAAEAYEALVAPVVQSKCVNCHVEGGESGHTGLVFVAQSDADHLAKNFGAFEDYLAAPGDGASRILAKIVGEEDHGGGVQVATDSAEHTGFEEFLTMLRAEKATIAGTVHAGVDGTSPLGGAECEFAAPAEDGLGPGRGLAAAIADADGGFRLLVPPDTAGYVVCRPAGLPRTGLWTYHRTGAAGTASDAAVTPGDTVATLALVGEAARDPRIDLDARAAALAEALAGDADFALLASAAAGLFGVLIDRDADVPYAQLLLDAFGSGRIDDAALAADRADELNGALVAAEQSAGKRVFVAATRTFADLPMLAHAKGVDDPAPPPPLPTDPADLADRAAAFRDAEFAANPALYYMNAHWAYGRGVDGTGEITGMLDTGIYAAHEEFAGRLHDETVYTVLGDDTDGDGWPQFSYFKVGEKDPATAYPEAQADSNSGCQGVRCKFYEYSHGSLMASLAVGARNGADAHGGAFGAKLLFRPFRQQGTLIGGIHYHPPGGITQPWLISRHQIVRQLGDISPIVANSWLTGNSSFLGGGPFHEVLTPRYVRYQRHRRATDQAVVVWSAGNRPISAGPLVDGAVVPSVSERQLRALSGGERGLADLLLTSEERAGLSADEALRRAERALAALRRRWLAVTALIDIGDNYDQQVDCAAGESNDIQCGVDWALLVSARCGFASDWCVAVGPTMGGVTLSLREPPESTGSYELAGARTSEAAATASGALAVLLQAYRDADGRLTTPTNTILKRLGATANRDVFDPALKYDWDQRNALLREEEMIRSLIRYAGASDDDLRELIDTARDEMNGTASDDDAEPGEPDADDRVRVLNRFVDYWATTQHGLIRDMLNAAANDEARARDLLAQLIRQVEWIDRQLLRLGRDKDTATEDDVRRIATTSLIGHGLIDLKAATDPAAR